MQVLVPPFPEFLGIALVVARDFVHGFLHVFLDVLIAVLDALRERGFREETVCQPGGMGRGGGNEEQTGGEEAAAQCRVGMFHDDHL